MKRRASVVLDAETYERLENRARRRGHSISAEIRAAVDDALAAEPHLARSQETGNESSSSPEGGGLIAANPDNKWLLDLIGIVESTSKPADWVHSDEFAREFADRIQHDSAGAPT